MPSWTVENIGKDVLGGGLQADTRHTAAKNNKVQAVFFILPSLFTARRLLTPADD